ncbi:MAG TPA: ABC transporter permease subunit [Ktedonobacterales bacterium]|nr:ABC transporter permease subunit [Ktedonobacterales bacterium]
MSATIVQDLAAMIWKELKEFFASGGGRGRYIGLIVLGVFGVILPLTTGSRGWAASPIPAVEYGLYLPVILILSVGADSFAGERERHTLETLLASRLPDGAIFFGKLLAITIFGWGQSLLAALVALIVINVKSPGSLTLYSGANMLAIVAIGLLASLLGAAATSLVSLRAATVRQAQQMLSIGLLVIILGTSFGLQALPAPTRAQLLTRLATTDLTTLGLEVAAALAVLTALLILWAMALFRRSKLILSGS